jgi:hypothetical protein
MGPGPGDSTSADADGTALGLPISRQTLLRLVIVVAIGIPIVLEGLTFLGLVGNQLDDGGDGGPVPTDGVGDDRRVDVGDDLLPGTDQRETLRAATVNTGDGWRFSLHVDVRNTGADGYRLAVTAVTTKSGTTITETTSTDSLATGDRTTLVGSWDLPDGEVPEGVTVRATVPTANGTRTVTETVTLDSVNIRG